MEILWKQYYFPLLFVIKLTPKKKTFFLQLIDRSSKRYKIISLSNNNTYFGCKTLSLISLVVWLAKLIYFMIDQTPVKNGLAERLESKFDRHI